MTEFVFLQQMLSMNAKVVILFFFQLAACVQSFSPKEAYKQLFDVVDAPDEPKGIPFPERIPSPKCRNERIAIVGAGPAGIHMAYLLKKKGFQNVVLLEKNEGVGEMSCTVRLQDTLQADMATLSVHHGDIVAELMREFEILQFDAMSLSFDQLFSTVNYSSTIVTEVMKLAQTTDPNAALNNLFSSLEIYIRLHRELFGKYDGALMRKPSPRVMKTLNCTFQEFIEKYNLTLLKFLLLMSKNNLVYGYEGNVSAVYGLLWNTPSRLRSYVAGIFERKNSHSYPIESDLQRLWENMKTSCNIDVRFNIQISEISRRNDKVFVRLTPSKYWEQFDFLIWTRSLYSNMLLLDASENERKIFSKPALSWTPAILDADTLRDQLDEEHTNIWVTESAKTKGVFNNERTQTCRDGVVSGGNDGDCSKKVKVNQQGTRKSDKHTISQNDFPHTNMSEDVKKKICSSYARFSPADMSAGILWDIFDIQGARRTWFAGSLVVVDSLRSVLEYNMQLVSKMTDAPYC